MVGGWETHARLNEVIFKALAPVLPERVPAGGKAMQCHAGFGGIDPRNGEYYCFLETLAGGYGARYRSDGPDAVQTHGQNTENAPIEETERYYPVRICAMSWWTTRKAPASIAAGWDCAATTFFSITKLPSPSWRIEIRPVPGGSSAANPAARLTISTITTAKGSLELQDHGRRAPRRMIRYETCGGGGGHGPPWQRDPQRVLSDVRQGKVSRERARDCLRRRHRPRAYEQSTAVPRRSCARTCSTGLSG